MAGRPPGTGRGEMGSRGDSDGAIVRKLLFAEEYTVDFNALAAVRRSGYDQKATSIAYKLLDDPEVKARIREIMAQRSNDIYVDQRWVISRLLEIHNRCMEGELITNGENMGKYRFEPAGANKSLELIGKHLGMFSDRFVLEKTGKMTNEDLIATAEAIIKSRVNKDQ